MFLICCSIQYFVSFRFIIGAVFALCGSSLSLNDGADIVLVIDGFIVKVQRPDGTRDAYFCGRHGMSCNSINVQYVTAKDGRVRHIITGCTGNMHDKTAASLSVKLRWFLDNLPPEYVILGNPAYRGLHTKVITTFTGHNLTPISNSSIKTAQEFTTLCNAALARNS